MGKMIHVAKKYEVEYSTSSCSNYKCGEFKDFLEELQPNNGWIITYNGDDYSDEFEVDKKTFERCIKVLELIVNADDMKFTELVKALNEATMGDDVDGYFDDKADYEDYVNVITDLAKNAGFETLESALEQLKSFYKICDKNYSAVHFCSF